MNIVLINPPLTSKERLYKELSAVTINYPPLGLCYLASALREEGHEVRIKDLQIQEHGEQDIGISGYRENRKPNSRHSGLDHAVIPDSDPESDGSTNSNSRQILNRPPSPRGFGASGVQNDDLRVQNDEKSNVQDDDDNSRVFAQEFRVDSCRSKETGSNIENQVNRVLNLNPDVVGITSTTVAIQNAAELAREIKKQRPDIPIILGGPHITAVPEKTMRMFPEFDIGVIGEGERTLLELVSLLETDSKQGSELFDCSIARRREQWLNCSIAQLLKEKKKRDLKVVNSKQSNNGTVEQLKAIPGLIYRKGTNINQPRKVPMELEPRGRHESKANERESEDKEVSRGLLGDSPKPGFKTPLRQGASEGQAGPKARLFSSLSSQTEIVTTIPRKPIENLDELPLPAFDLLPDLSHYGGSQFIEFQNRPTFRLVTSRGCPFHCAFCDKSIFGDIFRAHSPEYIMEMVRDLYHNYGVRHIYFSDDTFTLDRERVIELCRLLREFNEEERPSAGKTRPRKTSGVGSAKTPEVGESGGSSIGWNPKTASKLTWDCNTRVDTVDAEMLREMKKAGCTYIAYGIETGSQKILNNLNKGTTLANVENTCQMTKEAGIKIRGNFIMGNPGATEETIKKSIKFAKRLPLDTFKMSFFTPFPNTPLYEEIDKWGTYKEDWSKLSKYSPVFIPKNLTREQMEKLYKRAYFEFYFRPKIIWKYLKQLNSWGAIESALKKVGILVRFLLGKKTPTLIHANNRTNKQESDSRHSGPDPESDGDDRQILNRVQNNEESNAQDDDKEDLRGFAHFIRVNLRKFLKGCRPFITGIASLIILGVIASKINFRETWAAILQANPLFLAAAGALSLINNFLWITHKWKKVLEFLGSPLPYRKLLLPRVGGYPIHGILPAKTGEASRVAYLKKILGVPVKVGTATAVLTLILNLIALVIIAGTGLLVHQLIG